MHEAGLMRGLMRRIEAEAQQAGANRVTAVRVWLGALSHFSVEHFQEHWDISSAGTCAAGARLEVELSDDLEHPDAQGVVLKSIDVPE